jgi:hypothetical protein
VFNLFSSRIVLFYIQFTIFKSPINKKEEEEEEEEEAYLNQCNFEAMS